MRLPSRPINFEAIRQLVSSNFLRYFGCLVGSLYPTVVVAYGGISSAYMQANPASLVFAANYTYFDEQLDVIDYLDSLGTSSRPDEYIKPSFELGYRMGDWRPFIEFSEVEGSAVRERQPFRVESTANYMTLGLTRYFGGSDEGSALTLQFTDIEQDSLDIDCYERSGVVLGGSCEEADFQLVDGDLLLETGESVAFPVLTSSAEAISAKASVNWWNRWSSAPVLLGHSLSLSATELDHTNYSPLYDLQSSFLLNTPFDGKTLGSLIEELKQDLPQDEPWQEAVLGYDFSVSYFLGDWIFSGALGGRYVHRFNYSDAMKRKQYRSNARLSGEIWYQFEQAAVYLRGEAFSNYLLGIDPLAYNSKSSRFFEHPYGQLTAGFMLSFD